MNILCLVTLLSGILVPVASFGDVQTKQLAIQNGLLQLNVGEYRGRGEPAADILYFHGYGDRISNHSRLFSEWTNAGFRVIAFDLPSHGLTKTKVLDLGKLSFTDLARIAGIVEHAYIEDPKRPLVLAGWSLGGLLATRMTQAKSLATLSRKPSGLVLFAPGISIYSCVGNITCHITNETLTHDSSLFDREITPRSPIYRPSFGAYILTNAALAWHQSLPLDVPTFIAVAGIGEDRYVNSRDLLTWVDRQRQRGVRIQTLHCPDARHELDNELSEFGGVQVRAASTSFLNSIVGLDSTADASGPCSAFPFSTR